MSDKYDPRAVERRALRNSPKSPLSAPYERDPLHTYIEDNHCAIYLGEATYPPKQGNHWMKVLSPKLSDLSNWCLDHNLPLIGALIVRKGDRLQNDASIKNLYDFAQSVGIKTGRDPVAFVSQQAAMAQMLNIAFVTNIDQD